MCLYQSHIFFSSICERVTPRLAHANAAVVLSAVKVNKKIDKACFCFYPPFLQLPRIRKVVCLGGCMLRFACVTVRKKITVFFFFSFKQFFFKVFK